MQKIMIFLTLFIFSILPWANGQLSLITSAPDYRNSDFRYGEFPMQQDKSVDIFYVYPTIIVTPFHETQPRFWYANISLDSIRQKAYHNQKLNQLICEEYNFYAPFYRQMILDSYLQPQDTIIKKIPVQDMISAVQYYMKHYNNGRFYILLEHNQGSHQYIIYTDLHSENYYNENYRDLFPCGNLHFTDSWLYAAGIEKHETPYSAFFNPLKF